MCRRCRHVRLHTRGRCRVMRWTSYWTKAFDEGRHIDGRHGAEYVARVFQLERISGVPVMPHACGRKRYLYLAVVNNGGVSQAVGVYGTVMKAKREAERALRGVAL